MLSIRPAQASDVPTLNTLIHEFAEFERLPVAANEASLLRDGFGEAPKFRVLMAEWDGQPAGYALFFDYYSSFEGRPGLFLEDIYVRGEYRGKGIGKALLARVASVAREKNCFGVRWQVLDWNTPAIDFYKSLGATFLDDWKTVSLDGDALEQCGKGGAMTAAVKVIGAGLAGSEAAWQCARRGIAVELCEMRPVRSTPAHQTADFAELVCSNSLKSDSENTAPWLLKEEMRRAGSRLLEIARECAVPAGHALAVDRTAFAARVTEALSREPLIAIRREEVTQIDEAQITIIATGPLTSDALSAGNRAAERFEPLVFLRFDQSDRRSRFHRHVQGVPGGALRQRLGRLHQLPHVQGGVRRLLRCVDFWSIGRGSATGRS